MICSTGFSHTKVWTFTGAFSCEVGKEVDLSSSNISITYDILSSNPPIVEMKKSSTVGIEFCVTSSLNINEVNHQGDKTSIYGPVTEDQLTHDLITSGTTVKLVIHYDSLGQNLQIYSSTNGALIASTRSLPELGFSDSVNSIEVIHKNGINECQIIKGWWNWKSHVCKLRTHKSIIATSTYYWYIKCFTKNPWILTNYQKNQE